MLRHSFYHKFLRSSAVVVALMLAFESGMFIDENHLIASATSQYLANLVSVSASVPPNELNTITAALQARTSALDQRERDINARALDTSSDNSAFYSTFALSVILLIQLALIVSNYAFDFYRERKRIRTITT